MGANVVAWKQATRAELATTATFRIGYAQALLDLVKAFDRIPHWLIVREAIELGFPLWFVKLSLETYKLTRVIRIQQVVSHEVRAVRGITTGSGSACTEMKLVMIRIILKASEAHPTVTPCCFVDDLSADKAAPDEHVDRELGGFIEVVAAEFKANELELSPTKCVSIASSKALGEKLQARWKELGLHIPYMKGVKSLGAGLGAGVRRNVQVVKDRRVAFAARVPRFRWLRRIGIDAAMLVRTGGKHAMT